MAKEPRMINFNLELDAEITLMMKDLFIETSKQRTKMVQVLCKIGLNELEKLSPAKKKEVVQEIANHIYK